MQPNGKVERDVDKLKKGKNAGKRRESRWGGKTHTEKKKLACISQSKTQD